jgi:hypothetical protein
MIKPGHDGEALLARLAEEELQVRMTCGENSDQRLLQSEFTGVHQCLAGRAVHDGGFNARKKAGVFTARTPHGMIGE